MFEGLDDLHAFLYQSLYVSELAASKKVNDSSSDVIISPNEPTALEKWRRLRDKKK